jgi:MFS family permease
MSWKGLQQHIQLLHHRPYRNYYTAQLISMSGTFMQQMVQGWLVYTLSGSSFWLGTIALLTQGPAFLMSPWAGVIADQFDRKKLLSLVLKIQMIQAVVLAVLTLTGTISVPIIAVMAVILGCANAFELTTRHSFSAEMVSRVDLPSAIALNSFTINAARILGPLLGGLLAAVLNEGWCFALNALSFAFVIHSLSKIPTEPKIRDHGLGFIKPLVDGIHYVRVHRELLYPILYTGFLGFVGAPSMVLMPVFARDVFTGGTHTLGWLMTAQSLGALTGALLGIERDPRSPLWKTLMVRGFGFSFCLLGFAFAPSILLACLFLAGLGFFHMSSYPLINASLQHAVEDRMRSRMLSLYTMAFLGTLPVGGFLAGFFAEMSSAPLVIASTGGISLCVIILMAYAYQRKRVLS